MGHDHIDMAGDPAITEMQGMWILMVIMFVWNFLMTYQHRRLRDKVDDRYEDKGSQQGQE